MKTNLQSTGLSRPDKTDIFTKINVIAYIYMSLVVTQE